MKRLNMIGRTVGRLAAWLWLRMPVTRLRMLREVTAVKADAFARERQARERHEAGLRRAYKQADAIILRCADISFRRESGTTYAVTITFDARMMSGHVAQDELRYIARVIGRDLEAEIAACKFVEPQGGERGRWNTPPDTYSTSLRRG